MNTERGLFRYKLEIAPLGDIKVGLFPLASGIHRITQSVAIVAADLGKASSIPARSHTFVESDHGIISTDILLLPLIQEGLL